MVETLDTKLFDVRIQFFSTPPYQLQNLSLNWPPNFSFSGVLEQKEERNGQEQ
jgi:hypothetical protein